MKKRNLLILAITLLWAISGMAQQYTGMTGLIHVPDADMDTVGTARIGAHFLNKKFLPQQSFKFEGEHYNTGDAYLSVTPFKWMEIGYTMTLFRKLKGQDGEPSRNKKDRYFSIKFRPLAEGRWWPSVAIGANDFINSRVWTSLKPEDNPNAQNDLFRNYYIAVTKHFDIRGHRIGANVAYRHFFSGDNNWNGIVGGVTYRPAFFRPLRFILEYAGRDVNFGADCLLWKHLLIQVSLQRFKYPSGGLCYVVNLF